MIRADPWTFYYTALLIMLVPLNWLLAAAAAAVFHELCHIGVILIMGERIHGVLIRPFGAVIETSFSSKGRELAAALAGPMGSICLILLCHIWPRVALCAFIQGAFNLLPVYPLDGGRAVKCVWEMLQRKIPCKGRENAVQ